MDDVDQMLENELRRLDRAIAARKRKIDEALARTGKRGNPRRYTINVAVDATSTPTTSLQPVVGAQVIDQGTCFFCEELVGTVAALGSVSINGGTQSAKVSIRMDAAGFLFTWEMRDTFSDRAWQSGPLPNTMLASGKNSGFRLARPIPLPSGTEVELTVSPFLAATSVGAGPVFDPVTQWIAEISLCGYEVLT